MPVSDKRNELMVGLFLFVGLALLAGLTLQFGRFEQYFAKQYRITIVFDDASGLIKGSEVRMGGARIGRVAELPALTESVQVEVELAIDENTRIPVGSSFQIESATLLGDKLIVVVPPNERTGAFIQAETRHLGAGPTGLEALQNQAQIVSKDVTRVIQEAEITLKKVDGAVEEIQTASKQLGEALAKVNQSVLAEENLSRFDTTMANLAEVSAQWKKTSAELGPTLADARGAMGEIKTAAGSLQNTLANADQALAAIKPAVQGMPEAVRHISETAEKAGDTLDRMRRGEGMLGAFASDNEVAFDFKAFMKNLRRHGIVFYQDEVSGEPAPEASPPTPLRRGSKLR